MLQHCDAKELAPLLSEVAGSTCCWQMADGTWVREELLPRCVAGEDNSVVLRGNPTELEGLRRLVARLDVTAMRPSGRHRLQPLRDYDQEVTEERVPLHHARADEVAAKLRRTLTCLNYIEDASGKRACERTTWFWGEPDATTNTIRVWGMRCLVRDMVKAITFEDE